MSVHEFMNTSGLTQSKGFTLTLQETQSVYNLKNIQKLNLLLIFILYIVCQVSIFI